MSQEIPTPFRWYNPDEDLPPEGRFERQPFEGGPINKNPVSGARYGAQPEAAGGGAVHQVISAEDDSGGGMGLVGFLIIGAIVWAMLDSGKKR